MRIRGRVAGRLAAAWLVAAVGSIAVGKAEAQSLDVMPYEYRDALLGPAYEAQSADINADGLQDLVLRSRNPFVLAGLPLATELQWRASFLVVSNVEGNYHLDLAPTQELLDSVLWQPETHEILYGDVDGDGSVEALVRALRPANLSVLLTTSPQNGTPLLLQRMNYDDLGIDLGEAGLQVELYDISGDGLVDLVTGHGVELNTAHFSTRRQSTETFASEPTIDAVAADAYPVMTLVAAPLAGPQEKAQVNAVAAGPVVPGSMIGAFQVTPNGGASYSMALTLPPGLGGMTPQLSIEYNNNAPDTGLGLGMSLNGLSQISRCASTWRDTSASGIRGPDAVDFDDADFFCLDGQKLVTSGTYGALNQTYQTEMTTFALIKSVGSTSARNPDSWTVQTKSGLKMTYGGAGYIWNGNRTNQTYVWLLKSTEDTTGNIINFEYEFPLSGTVQASYRISAIRYGGNPNAGLAQKSRVAFSYVNRNGYQPRGYMHGSVFQRNYVLEKIEAFTTGATEVMTRSWNFTYHAPEQATNPYPPGTTPPPCRPGKPCQQPYRMAQSATVTAAKAQSLSRYAMTSIQECAGSASNAAVPCLPSTTFAWTPAIGAPSGAVVNSNAGTLNADYEFSNGDVNGAGFTDLLERQTATVVASVRVRPKDGASGLGEYVSSITAARPNKDPKWVTGDFNGDGRLDIAFYFEENACGNPIYYRYGNENYSFTTEVKVEMDVRSGPNCSAGATSHPSTGGTYYSVTQMLAGDVDGDGRDDLIMIANHSNTGFRLRHLISTGAGFTVGAWGLPTGAGIGGGANVEDLIAYTGDFNGDGKTDLALLDIENTNVFAFICMDGGKQCSNLGYILEAEVRAFPPLIGDANGDGYSDLTFVRRSGAFAYTYTFLSTGTGTLQQVIESNAGLTVNNDYRISSGDFDGDGALDIVWVDYDTPHDIVLLAGTGTGSFKQSEVITAGLSGIPWTYNAFLPGDYDGDGKMDLVVYGRSSTNITAIREVKFTGASNLRVGKITSGLGSVIDIEYQPLTVSSVYEETSASAVYPTRRFVAPQYVVQSQTSSSDGLEARITRYTYSGSRLDVQGRGPLGFHRTKIQDYVTGHYETTTYSLIYPTIGMPLTNIIRDQDNLEISAEEYIYQWGDSQQGSLFVYPGGVTSKDYETTPGFTGLTTTTTTTTAYSTQAALNYGNPNATEVKVYAGAIGGSTPFVTTTENSYDNFNDNGRWQIGRLKRAKVTKTNPAGDSDFRTTDYEYDATTGLLSAEIVEPLRIDHPTAGNQYVRKEYVRDAVGNITTTTIKANVKSGEAWALQTRTTSASYSNAAPYFQRFQTGACNAVSAPLTACTSAVPDFKTGSPLTSTDANGLATTSSYDAFGRLQGTSFVNGGKSITTTLNRFWCASDMALCFNEANGIYGVETTTSTGGRSIVVYDGYEREIRNAAVGPDGAWRYTRNTYNSLGQLNSARSLGGYLTSYFYDGIQGRLELVRAPSKETNTTGREVETSYRGLTKVTWDARNNSTTTVTNAMGKVVSVTNAKNEVMTYEYDAFDNLTKSHDPAGNEIVLTYDRHGRKRTLDDPDLGKWNYEYNGFGELVSQTDAKGQTSALLYDAIGRLIERSDYLADGSLETRTVWTYDSLGGSTYKGFLFQVRQTDSSGNEIVKRTYQPDNIGNVASESIYVEGGLQGATSRTFDSSNRVNTMTYPSGLVVKHRYNSYGALYELRDSTVTGAGSWNASSWDALGQINQSQLGNGLTTSITRDQAVGIEKEIQVGSGSIQKWTYDWDANGNITSRTNGIAAITYTETASYDALDRVDTMLLTTSVGSSSKQTTYDAIGNIQSYPDSGTYTYDTAKRPHAVTATTAGSRAYSYDANGNMRWGDAAGGRRNYTWATFNLPTQVTQGSASAQFLYGPEREKVRQISSSPFIPGRTSYYLDAVAEKHVTASGTEYRELIVSPTGVIAQSSFYPSTGIRNTLYVHTDNLGSIDAVTNESAQNLALINAHPGFGYDQWGNRRDDSGNGSPSSMEFAILKGYTGHDMLDTVNLIHMKGRVYDPAIGRFLSPDPIIQDPNNLQAYNRYGYVSNNPLTNTDPTGYSWLSKTFKKAAKWVGDNWRVLATIAITVAAPYALYGQSMAQLSFGKALITGALGGFAGGLVTGHGDLKAALIGAAVGAAFAGVGQTVGKGATWSKPVPMLKKVVAHGLVGGLTSVGQGGRFGQGFLSSGTSAFFSPAFDKATGPLTGTAIAAVIGGTVSEIGGGKFANGAVTSAAGYAFNSLASLLDEVTPAPGEGVPADIQPEVELLNGAAAAAARTVDSMPGWRPAWLRGIMIHYQFKLNILALAAEGLPVGAVSYKGRVVVPYGKLGSVRPDAVWGSPLSPQFAFELKTGGAYMSKGDLGRYTDNLPAGTRIIESGGFWWDMFHDLIKRS